MIFIHTTPPHMAIPRQGCIEDINSDLPDDLSTHPPPLPPRKPLTTPERFSEEQHRNGKSSPRLPETLNLMTFQNDDEDTKDLTASWECTGNSFDSVISECPLLNLSDSSETDEIHDKMYSGLETNMSDRLDKYFSGDLFKKSSDLDSETRPRLYTPDFSTCIKGIDAEISANRVDLPTLPGERHQNQSDSFEVIDSTKSITHLMNTPSQSSKPNAMKSDTARFKRSSVFLNCYFRENSNDHLDDVNPPITFKTIQDYDTESGEKDDIWDTPTPRQQDVYLKKLRELEQEVKQIQQLQKSSTETLEISNIHRPKLSSQISQDIDNEWILIKSDNHDMKKSSSIDNINRRTNRDRYGTIQYDQSDIRASSSFENIKTKATKLWGKITKRDKDSSDGTSPKLLINVGARVELSCPCERSCDSASSKRFQENSNYNLDDVNPSITFKSIHHYDTESGEKDNIWDTPTHRQQESWDVCTGNAFDNIIPECTLLNLSGNSETDETHHKIHSGLETYISDGLDKYFIGDLFRKSSDLDSETRPRLYTPDFSTCSKGIDAEQSAISVDLPTLTGETQSQSYSFEVVDSTKSITHLTNTPSQSSKPNAMKTDSARFKRSSVFLNSYFRENSNYHLDDVNPPITLKTMQDYDTESGEKDDIWDTPTPRQQDVYLKKLRELEQEVKQIQQLQKSSTETLEILNIHRPKLSSQLSLSDSDISISWNFEDNMVSQDITNEWIVIKSDNDDMKKSSSIDNINRRANRDRSSTIQYDQSDIRASPSFENIKTNLYDILY